MIEVTNEQREAGGKAANAACFEIFGNYWNSGIAERFADAAYRAMRALEAGPDMTFAEKQARTAALNTGISAAIGAPLPPVGYGARTVGTVGISSLDPRIDRAHRRIDTLQALVRLLVSCVLPVDAHVHEELKRLIAELEATR